MDKQNVVLIFKDTLGMGNEWFRELLGMKCRWTECRLCESDVDVALLVKGSLAPETEDTLSDFIVDMNLKYDKVFSVIDIDIDNYEKWKAVTPFYKNVKQDGIVLWKVA